MLFVVPCVAIVVWSRDLLRRRLTQTEIAHAEKVVPFLLGTVGSFYGLISGFMLSNSWTQLRQLQSSMTAEVSAMADMSRIASNLPKPFSDEMQSDVYRYLQTLIDSELPLMKRGQGSETTTRALTDMWSTLGRFKPQSSWEGTLQGTAVNKLLAIGEQRRERLFFSRQRLPPMLWWILIGSSLIIVSGASMASLTYHRPAGFFLGSVVAVLVVVLLSIRFLERPFQYRLATQPNEYVVLWQLLGGPQAASK